MNLSYTASLLAVLCAALSTGVGAQCGAGLLYCSGINQCYSQGVYNCIPQPTGSGSFLCPTNTCLCGQSTCYTSQYGCKDGGLTQNPKDDKDGRCGGGSGGDPLMRNFDGCRWYLSGVAGKVYNLVAGAEDTVNTLLVPANLTDADHKGNGTYHGTLSFRHLDHLVEAEVSAEGNLTVTVDGEAQPFDSRFHAGEMKGKVVRHMTFFGQYLEITTPSFTYAVQAVQPVIGASGFQRGHADIDITLRKAVSRLHGLLGQSYQSVQAPQCLEDYNFPGEGKEEDYLVSNISVVPEVRSAASRVSRKLIEVAAGMFPVSASTYA